jgi:hypothetical protein
LDVAAIVCKSLLLKTNDGTAMENQMNEHRVEPPAGSELPEQIDDKIRQSDAIKFLLTRVPGSSAELSASGKWIECDRKKPDPHGIY